MNSGKVLSHTFSSCGNFHSAQAELRCPVKVVEDSVQFKGEGFYDKPEQP